MLSVGGQLADATDTHKEQQKLRATVCNLVTYTICQLDLLELPAIYIESIKDYLQKLLSLMKKMIVLPQEEVRR